MRERSPASRVRPAAVAGAFYPRDAGALREQLAGFLAGAPPPGARRPKALVVPHAGYVYSGPIAASAYAQLRAPGPVVERVVLLGPSHHVAVDGLALPEADRFATPLGEIPVDAEAARRALDLRQVVRSEAAHAREHSLEVQLPFLQELLGPFALVPFAIGLAAPEEVAEVLAAVWGGGETLVVISTDLSHYLPYHAGRTLDRHTAASILALDATGIDAGQACGRAGLAGLLFEARRRRLAPEELDLRSSGDTGGDRDAVVGYGAFAFHEPPAAEPASAGETGDAARRAAVATGIARQALASLHGGPAPELPDGEPWLREWRSCFVSLHRRGELRGCVGTLAPRGPLFDEIVRCAVSAATEDHRFPPVAEGELAAIDLEVSVLSPLEPVEAEGEEEALRAIRPGVDGLVIEAGGRRGTFIPAMWEQLPDPREFLLQLRRKAGLPPGWLPGTRLQRFTAERYREPRPR